MLAQKLPAWFQHLLNGGLPEDTPQQQDLRQRRIIALTVLAFIPLGLLTMWMNLLIEETEDNWFIGTGLLLGVIALALQTWLSKPRVAAHIIIFAMWMVPSLAMADRGVYGISIIWLLLLPILATLLVNGLGGVLWACASLATIWTYTVLDLYGIGWAVGTDNPVNIAIEASFAVIVTLGATLVFRLGQVSAEQRLETTVEELNREVEVRERAEQAAREAEAAKGDFLASMSHELRTPLNGVIGSVELLGHTKLDTEQQQLVKTVQNSGEILLNLIRDVLDVSRLDTGALELETTAFDLSAACAAVCDSLAVNARGKGLTLIADIDPATGWRMGDQVRVQQILINLLGNAIKFTERGEIICRCEAVEQGVRLSVKDSGIGIPESAQATLFDAYQQASADTNRKYGGSGLGLAIVSRLVALMQGKIELDSKPGEGATFTVILPLPTAQAESAQPEVTSAATHQTLKILVADDNPTNRMVARKMLSLLGHDVSEAVDGADAIDKLSANPIDLVFMDVEMPNMDGREATRQIRSSQLDFNAVPIVGLTANALPGDREELLSLGMDDYLVKPVKMQSLAAIIASVGPTH